MKKSILLMVLMLIVAVTASLVACGSVDTPYTPVGQDNWMSLIADDTPITKLAIPGTHDSGTVGMMSSAMTQGVSIGEQLKMGARYFDIRVHDNGKGGQIFHGPIKGEDFPTIVNDIATFMKDVKSEFVVLDFQHFSHGGEQVVYDALVSSGLIDIAVDNDTNMSDNDYLDTITLGDVRGKALVFFGNDMADKYTNIFKRNNDDCTREGSSMDSLYIGDMHKKGSDYFVSEALPKYFEHILGTNSAMTVLQGQLTAPNIFKSLFDLEREHNDNMNNYVKSIKDNAKYLENVNIIMRDFFDQDVDKFRSIVALNYYKGYVKKEQESTFKTLVGIE